MPRQPEPWFRDGRGWYVQLDGRQTFLGEHPEGQPRPKKGEDGRWKPPPSIRAVFHKKMAERDTPPSPTTPLPPPGEQATVVTVLDAFLDWLDNRVREGTKSSRTYDWYLDYLQDFTCFQGVNYRIRDLTAAQVLPVHVYQWADSHPGWTTGKRGAMTAVQRAFGWAAKAGLLGAAGVSPLRALEKPAQGRRERLFTEAEYTEVLALVKDRNFRDLIELSWETGCRPHELFTVEASHVEKDVGRWVFPIRLSKGKKLQRVVYLSDRALEITLRLAAERPTGPLLVNTQGRAWCVSSVKCRFQQLCREIGRRRMRQAGELPPKIPRLKVAQRSDPAARREHEARVLARRQQIRNMARVRGLRVNLYGFRHARITEALVQGLDAVTVSILAGHKDTTMISRHYAHLTQRDDHMRKAANRAIGKVRPPAKG
jgi:integrase